MENDGGVEDLVRGEDGEALRQKCSTVEADKRAGRRHFLKVLLRTILLASQLN